MKFEQSEKDIENADGKPKKDPDGIIKKNGVVITKEELKNITEDSEWWRDSE